ncbi:MAG: TonB-dependent receptor, partial [Bryobacterales bacterium]|nr:TonB-dependent receptor [Bryobacterales bacterium]
MDGLRFTTGYRYTWDKISGTNSSYSYIPDVGPGGSSYYIGCGWDSTIIVTNPMVDCLYGASRKDKAGTWLLGIDYRPVDSLFVYAKGSRGYKAGGFNTFSVFPNTRTFGPEFVTDYEAGFKSDFYIGGAPVRLNTNIFYLDYSHIQRTAPDYNITTNANGAVALSTASATIKGIEIEVVARPMDFLEVGGNYSHLTSHYKSFRFNSNSGVRDCTAQSIVSPLTYTDADMSCRPLLFLSPKIFSLYGRASIPMSKRSGDLSLFVSYSWTDKQPFSVLGIEKFPDGTIMEPGAELPAFGLVSASIDWRNALGSSFDVSLFGTNLTDKEYLIGNSGVYQSTGAQTQIYGEPRMYGVRVKYSL